MQSFKRSKISFRLPVMDRNTLIASSIDIYVVKSMRNETKYICLSRYDFKMSLFAWLLRPKFPKTYTNYIARLHFYPIMKEQTKQSVVTFNSRYPGKLTTHTRQKRSLKIKNCNIPIYTNKYIKQTSKE